MRFLVTPEFNAKLAQASDHMRSDISGVIKFIQTKDKETILAGSSDIDVRYLAEQIILIKSKGYSIYASFAKDGEGEHLLLLDLTGEQAVTPQSAGFNAVKDPRRIPAYDPARNAAIDPRRNSMIDPQRNMMIDPNRNMMIDPNRNMMVDPNRNMMVDPRRNMMIDPQRNMMIDPRRNRFYGGPYVYNLTGNQEGYLVRANDDVSLVFNLDSQFIGFLVNNKSKGANYFTTSGEWIGFVVNANSDVGLIFRPNGQWSGFIV